MASHLREAALFYLKRGWSVIPIAPTSKKPPKGFEWTTYQERLPTYQEVQAWWRRWPHYGVGIITGKVSNLVVLDVDPRHGGDANHIYKTFPTDIVAMTGSGGGHFYYEYPAGQEIRNTVGKTDGEPNGYDIRADGGYVVAPPTLHPSGRRYTWLTTGKKPAPLAPKLLTFVAPKADLNGTATMTEPWLADALRGVGEGARDDTCARLAGYYFKKGMPKDVIIEQLKMWNERNDQTGTPFTDADVVKTVESVERTRARHPVAPVKTSARNLEDQPQDLLRLMSLHQYMSAYGQTDVRWSIEGWLPAATIAMMVSPPGTYKTWTLIDLAISIATGTAFLGTEKVLTPGPVLIYQQEDFHGQMAQRIGTIMAGRFPMGSDNNTSKDIFGITLPPSPPIYLHDNRELRFDNAEVMDVLEARIAELRPALVIGDPLYTMASMDEYMAKAVPHMMRLKKLRDLYGCSFMLAHHTGKNKDKDKSSREDAWGSQFLNAFLETGWQVRPKREGTALIRRHFKVAKDVEEMALTFDIRTDTPSRYVTTLAELQPTLDTDIGIIRILDKHGAQTRKQLADRLDLSEQSVWRQVKPLIEAGSVVKDQGVYFTPDHFDVREK